VEPVGNALALLVRVGGDELQDRAFVVLVHHEERAVVRETSGVSVAMISRERCPVLLARIIELNFAGSSEPVLPWFFCVVSSQG